MAGIVRIAVVLLALWILVACGPKATPTPVSTPTPEPTDTPVPTATPEPTLTAIPSPTPFPTASEPAPESTFTSVGNVAKLSGEHGVSGTAIVAGLQTLIVQSFNYDGKGPRVDIRLVKGEDYENPAAILVELEQRAYDNEMVLMIIPSAAGPGKVDRVAIYCPETGEVYAWGTFD